MKLIQEGCLVGYLVQKPEQIRNTEGGGGGENRGEVWQLNKEEGESFFRHLDCLISGATQCCRLIFLRSFYELNSLFCCVLPCVFTVLNYVHLCWHPCIGTPTLGIITPALFPACCCTSLTWFIILAAGGTFRSRKLHYPRSLHRSGAVFGRGSAAEFNAIINK